MTTNNDKNGLLKISMEFPHISTNDFLLSKNSDFIELLSPLKNLLKKFSHLLVT